MSSDDQYFLDVLSTIPTSILHYSSTLANTLERKLDESALAWRERLSSAPWLPDSIRPAPPPPPAPLIAFPNLRSYGNESVSWRVYAGIVRWVDEHRALTAALVAFAGTGGWLVYSRRKAYARKRRAKRGPGGAKKEVVVVAGTPSSPLPWSIVLDLERRGFLVYVVVGSSREEDMVKSERKPDIMPLYLNVTDPFDVQAQLTRLSSIFSGPENPTSHLTFAGLLLIPDLHFPTGPLEIIPGTTWSDTLSTKLLSTILTTQAFLPLIRSTATVTTTSPNPNPTPTSTTPPPPPPAKILLLTPTLLTSLNPAFHTPESTTLAGLTAFATSLRTELGTINIPVVHFKLGTFDSIAPSGPRSTHLTTYPNSSSPSSSTPTASSSLARRETMTWSSTHRAAYAQNYVRQSDGTGFFTTNPNSNTTTPSKSHPHHGVKGTPLRELHNAVFDALTTDSPRGVWRVGRGSLAYEIVGNFVPRGFLGWMMGLERVVTGEGAGAGWRGDGGRVQGIGDTCVY